MPCNFMKPKVSLPKSTNNPLPVFVTETGDCGVTGNLNVNGFIFGSLKFQYPAVSHFVAERSDVFPVSSIHSLSSKVTSQVLSEIIVFPCTKILGTAAWQNTFTFNRCFPFGTITFDGVPCSNCPSIFTL